MADAAQQTSPKTGSPTQPQSPSQPHSPSTSNSPSPNYETGRQQSAQNTTIGTPPSATALDALRNLAKQAGSGIPVTDASLQASLRQAFGSRLVLKPKKKAVYEREFGYDEEDDGWDIAFTHFGSEDGPLVRAIEFFNKPATSRQIVGVITRMRVSLLRRTEDNDDVEVLIDTLSGLCREYPADVVIGVAQRWIKTEKFFPIPKEFLEALDNAVAFRKALLSAVSATKMLPNGGSAPQPNIVRRPAVREEDSPAGQERRAELEAFLKSKGDDADYSNTKTMSNYRLEGLARCKYGWRGYQSFPIPRDGLG